MLFFGVPIAAWVCVASAAVAAAYLYRRRSHVVDVPAVVVWNRLGQPVDVRSIASLARRLLSLAAQLLMLVLFAMALRESSHLSQPPRRWIIIVDQGATMQTEEIGASSISTSRFEFARQAAKAFLSRSGRSDRALVIGAGIRPRAVSSHDIDPVDAENDLDRLGVLDVDSDLPAALNAAVFAKDDPGTDVIFFSDFAGTDATALDAMWRATQPAAKLTLVAIGVPHPDSAIDGITVEPGTHSNGWRIDATVVSGGLSGQPATAKLICDERSMVATKLILSDQPQHALFDVELPPGTAFEIEVEGQDQLRVDDHCYAVIPRARKGVCLISSEHASPLVAALRADPTVPQRIVSPDEFNGPLGDEAVVVVESGGYRGPFASNVGWLFIGRDAVQSAGLDTVGDVKNLAVSYWVGDHPTLLGVDPDLFQIHRVVRLNPSGASARCIPLVSAASDPVIIEVNHDDAAASDAISSLPPHKVIGWLFDLADTDLRSRMAFPILLWNTIDYLAGVEPPAPQVNTGQTLYFDGPPPPTLVDPSQQIVQLRRVGDKYAATDLVRQGHYRCNERGEARLIGVSLLSDRGTKQLVRPSPGTITAEALVNSAEVEIAGVGSARNLREAIRSAPRWQLYLIGALGCAVFEWFLYHRRIVRVG